MWSAGDKLASPNRNVEEKEKKLTAPPPAPVDKGTEESDSEDSGEENWPHGHSSGPEDSSPKV